MALELDDSNNLQINRFKSRVVLGQPEHPKVLDFILKTGIVKTEKSALTILILLTVLIFGISIYIFATGATSETIVAPQITYPDGSKSPDLTNR
ncbi:MAG: hypothetical protein V4576_01375 [Patescibacteria group bacterium]